MKAAGINQIFDKWSDMLELWGSISKVDDIAMYKHLARQVQGGIVELGIGDGRVAQEVKPHVGVDFSERMLEKCKERFGVNSPALIQSSFSAYRLPEPAQFSYSPLNTFNHIPPSQRLDSLNNIYRNTEPGGTYVFDSIVPNTEKLTLRNNLQVFRGKTQSFALYEICSLTDKENNEYELTMVLEELNDNGEVVKKKYYPTMPFYYIYPEDYQSILAKTEWSIENVYGGFNFEKLQDDSKVQVYVLRRHQ